MNRKIIFLDIDGTLTSPGSNEPPVSAQKAIREARKKGNLVYLCTGRNYDMLSPLLQYGFDGVIGSSGAYIMCDSEVIYDCYMTEEEKRYLMNLLKADRIYKTVECLDGSFTDEGFKEFLEANIQQGENSELLRWRRQIESSLNIKPMSEYKEQPIYKIVVMTPDRGKLEQVREKIGDKFNMCIQETDQYGIANGEIIKKEYDKGKAVERVCEKLGIHIDDTYAFGDSMNDLEMMEKVGCAICMENGSTYLKKLADDICPSVEADGLYKAFQKYKLM